MWVHLNADLQSVTKRVIVILEDSFGIKVISNIYQDLSSNQL